MHVSPQLEVEHGLDVESPGRTRRVGDRGFIELGSGTVGKVSTKVVEEWQPHRGAPQPQDLEIGEGATESPCRNRAMAIAKTISACWK